MNPGDEAPPGTPDAGGSVCPRGGGSGSRSDEPRQDREQLEPVREAFERFAPGTTAIAA